jgi:Chalcone isomerase-like
MKPFYRSLIVLLAMQIAVFGAFAQTTQAAQTALPMLPADVSNTLPNAEFAGKGKLTFFGLEVYESSLWVSPNFKGLVFENHSFALELHYLRNFSASDIAKRSLEEMQRIEPIAEQKAALWLKILREALPDVKKGDRLIGLHKPGGGVEFWLNGKRASEIRDPNFSRQFFAIWLSPKTSEPKLRMALLGYTN